MIEDINDRLILSPDKSDIGNLILNRKPNYFSYEDWNKINKYEVSNGQPVGRPRIKLYEISKMLELVRT